MSAYELLEVYFIVIILSIHLSPCPNHNALLLFSAFAFCLDVLRDNVDESSALELQIPVEGLDLGGGLVFLGKERCESIEGDERWEGSWREEEGCQDYLFGGRHFLVLGEV